MFLSNLWHGLINVPYSFSSSSVTEFPPQASIPEGLSITRIFSSSNTFSIFTFTSEIPALEEPNKMSSAMKILTLSPECTKTFSLTLAPLILISFLLNSSFQKARKS